MHDKYKIKRNIVNCEKIESVTSHDLYPPPLSQTVTLSQTPSPWSVTYFMDGPQAVDASFYELTLPNQLNDLGFGSVELQSSSSLLSSHTFEVMKL